MPIAPPNGVRVEHIDLGGMESTRLSRSADTGESWDDSAHKFLKGVRKSVDHGGGGWRGKPRPYNEKSMKKSPRKVGGFWIL